jgi:septum formation protein
MNIILGSSSPRRKLLLTEMGYSFAVCVSNAEENYDEQMDVYEVAPYLAHLKANSLIDELQDEDVLICCDTVVIHNGLILGKPNGIDEAIRTIENLSGEVHEVMSAVTMFHNGKWIEFHEITQIEFDNIKKEDIEYYVNNLKPFDKAGSYGIQEWIGLIGVKRIEGSYSNVIGLPTQKLFHALKKWGVSPY